jgi:Tfp pilus assembly protein PilO
MIHQKNTLKLFSVARGSLRRKIIFIVLTKIMVLTLFWQVVLRHQAVHVEAEAMENKLFTSQVPHNTKEVRYDRLH